MKAETKEQIGIYTSLSVVAGTVCIVFFGGLLSCFPIFLIVSISLLYLAALGEHNLKIAKTLFWIWCVFLAFPAICLFVFLAVIISPGFDNLVEGLLSLLLISSYILTVSLATFGYWTGIKGVEEILEKEGELKKIIQ